MSLHFLLVLSFVICSHGFDYTLLSLDKFEFVNISSTQSWKLTDSEIIGPLPLPFDFAYYGTIYNSIYIGSNGIISFMNNTDPNFYYVQCDTDGATYPNNSLLHYAADLNPNGVDPIFISFFELCPIINTTCACVVIEYQNYHRQDAVLAGTWEVILWEDGNIAFSYLDTGPAVAFTAIIGITHLNDEFLQVRCAVPLYDESSFLFTPTNGSLVDLRVYTAIYHFGVLELHGVNFGSIPEHLSIKIGKEFPCDIITVNNTMVTCTMDPHGTGANQSLIIEYKGITYNTSFQLSYSGPTVVNATAIIPTTGGALSVTGTGLGNKTQHILIFIGGLPCVNVTFVSDTTITCFVPPGTGVHIPVVLDVNGQTAVTFANRSAPVIANVTLDQGMLVVDGLNFGNNRTVIRFWVNGTLCSKLNITIPHYQFTCHVTDIHGTVPTKIAVDSNYNLTPGPNVTFVASESSSTTLVNQQTSNNGPNLVLVAVITVVGALVIIIALISVAFYVARKRTGVPIRRPTKRGKRASSSEVSLEETIVPAYAPHYTPIPIEKTPSKESIAAVSTPVSPEFYLLKYNELFIDEKNKLGSGAFGEVYKGTWRGTAVAVKRVNKLQLSKDALNSFKREAELMCKLRRHPNVTPFLGFCDDPLCIVLEFMEAGSLHALLRKNIKSKTLSMDQKRKWIKEIAAGMLHLHCENIIHRDLAARNVLIGKDMSARISDFGYSKVLTQDNSKDKSYAPMTLFPFKWMAPEYVDSREFTMMSDVWSYGVTCLEIITDREPYHDIDMPTFVAEFMGKKAPPLLDYLPEDTPPDIRDLIASCFASNPSNRPTFKDICDQANRSALPQPPTVMDLGYASAIPNRNQQ